MFRTKSFVVCKPQMISDVHVTNKVFEFSCSQNDQEGDTDKYKQKGYLLQDVCINIYKSSSSSCRATCTDLPDPHSPPISIIYHSP